MEEKMKWERLLSTKRFGLEKYHASKEQDRAEFQRDYDRLIFSSPFRRLQNKTQVFPLPGSVFVHNRLTHSLEVACVGRSLGNNVSRALSEKNPEYNQIPFLHEISAIVSAACLAHDLGNPPFGHSGETAIASFFSDGNGKQYQACAKNRWSDFCFFEGNANTFRLLTNQFNGRRAGGFVLTYATLASVIKYPFESTFVKDGKKKFGFFQPEKAAYYSIAEELGIIRNPNDKDKFARYPLVYLVEAADDICYQIMDIEDAHKLKILTTEETKALLFSYFNSNEKERMTGVMNMVDDTNEQIAYLRSSVIGKLVAACTAAFIENEEKILSGTFEGSLIDAIDAETRKAYRHCAGVSFKKIYKSTDVLDIELAGYKIILTLLDELVQAVMSPQQPFSKTLLSRIPMQYDIYADDDADKIQAIIDYVSGMTDVFALDLYRKITGMSLPSL